jgi:hypothetical protein
MRGFFTEDIVPSTEEYREVVRSERMRRDKKRKVED